MHSPCVFFYSLFVVYQSDWTRWKGGTVLVQNIAFRYSLVFRVKLIFILFPFCKFHILPCVCFVEKCICVHTILIYSLLSFCVDLSLSRIQSFSKIVDHHTVLFGTFVFCTAVCCWNYARDVVPSWTLLNNYLFAVSAILGSLLAKIHLHLQKLLLCVACGQRCQFWRTICLVFCITFILPNVAMGLSRWVHSVQ